MEPGTLSGTLGDLKSAIQIQSIIIVIIIIINPEKSATLLKVTVSLFSVGEWALVLTTSTECEVSVTMSSSFMSLHPASHTSMLHYCQS